MNIRPNLYLIGAPKSATTTLHVWLDSHPSVTMSKNKEPRFHCNDRLKVNGPGSHDFLKSIVSDETDYLELFDFSDDTIVIGESSTDYLWMSEVPGNIYRYTGENCQFICILRDPVERAYSEHMHLIRDGLENGGFVDSLAREQDRIDVNYQPLFYHVTRSLYHDSLLHYFSIFGRDAFYIVDYSDIQENANFVLKDICEFLCIEIIDLANKIRLNRSGTFRIRWFQDFQRKESIIKNIIKAMMPNRFLQSIKYRLNSINLVSGQKITESEWNVAFEYFKNDIEKLEILLDREFPDWKRYR